MLLKIYQGVISSRHILNKFLNKGEIVRYSNRWNPVSSKPQTKKINKYHAKRREESKDEAPVASTSKPQANQPPQEGKKKNKKNWRTPYSPTTGFGKSKDMPCKMFSTWPEP
ncbi:hypothetical protein O181_060823 [Austropuccinia psidii MF-1]|uniref:Uncharacterized protein n=1 Tax=Austropuccinia psidii MF-1 TaxID=1389203 RepID=A0A9Q3HXW5_9BASI|nr:hypothetical protein [Austropuccinia psidii MF-1]